MRNKNKNQHSALVIGLTIPNNTNLVNANANSYLDLSNCYFSPVTEKQFNNLKKGGSIANVINYPPSNISNENNNNFKLGNLFTAVKDFYYGPKKYSAKIKIKLRKKVDKKISNFKTKAVKLKNIFSSYLTRNKDYYIRQNEKVKEQVIEKTYSANRKDTWKRALKREISAFSKYATLYSNKVQEKFENSILYNKTEEIVNRSIIAQSNTSKRELTNRIFSKKKIINKGLDDKLNSLFKQGTKFDKIEKYVNSFGMNISKSTYYRIRNKNNYFI